MEFCLGYSTSHVTREALSIYLQMIELMMPSKCSKFLFVWIEKVYKVG